ncbi:MAG: hypothetical protein RLN75_07930 [Longimicrobiales bacterium]
MKRSDESEEASVPAGVGARLLLTLTPFVAAFLVWVVLRWVTG